MCRSSFVGGNLSQINDEESEEGSGTADSGTLVPDSDVWAPSYFDIKKIEKNEALNQSLAENALFLNRLAVKAQKFDVTALNKSQQRHTKSHSPDLEAPGGGGLGLESHPELEDLGGQVDPNHVVLPESEAINAANNDPKLQHKLKQKQAQKFGMGSIGSLSKEALEAEYKKKMRMRVTEKPADQPRFRAAPTPKNTM